MQKGKIGLIVVLAFLAGGVYFIFVRYYCEEVIPPKQGQQDSPMTVKDDKLYVCQSYFQRLLNKPTTGQPSSQVKPLVDERVDISDWKTYRDMYYGFEFKYPPSFLEDAVDFRSPAGGFYLKRLKATKDDLTVNIDENEMYNAELLLSIAEQPWVMDEFYHKFYQEHTFDPTDLSEILGYDSSGFVFEKMSIGALELVKMQETASMNQGNHFVIVFDNYLLDIHDVYGFYETVAGGKIMSEVLSTFKFINRTYTPSSGGLKGGI